MINLLLSMKFNFSRPWYLLALIPFAIFTLLPYFRLSKRYRKTRNRITSMVLHAIVSILIVFILSGMTIVNSESNASNEIILLVDLSETEDQSEAKRDEFVKTVINECKFDNFKIGIVTFGYDQEYAVELTRDYKNIYSEYKAAARPDSSATNIAGALTYAEGLFSEKAAKKIVLVTDYKETDENAKSVIRSIAAQGITIDTAYLSSSYDGDDAEIVSVVNPETHVSKGDTCEFKVNIKSNYSTTATLKLYDGTESVEYKEIEIAQGENTFIIEHQFTSDGLHEMKFVIEDTQDLVSENNEYTSYYYLEEFNKLLIIEQESGASDLLYKYLTEEGGYNVTTLNINLEDLPKTAEDLCAYDEIILNNISNADMGEDFVEELNSYVYDYGGGLFTVGGTEAGDTETAHAYNRVDMVGSLYQQMLPVQAINYTPPVGVIVIIDRSGSMGSTSDGENSYLDWATEGAASCLNALTERDYIGIMTLDSDYSTILELTPVTQRTKILSAINSIDKATGGTVFPGAILRAGEALRSLTNVDKRHIIIVSDGQVPTSEIEAYEAYAKNFYETDGITISVIGINMAAESGYENVTAENYDTIPTGTAYERMLRLTKLTHGTLYPVTKDKMSTLQSLMREDLNVPEIKEVDIPEGGFSIVCDNITTSSLYNGVLITSDEKNAHVLATDSNEAVKLKGFNGTKVRSSADLYLTGEYSVPIYAQWKYGNGTVGSFMADLSGVWSDEFLDNESCRQLLYNIVKGITPTESIRINDLKVSLFEDNYSNTLSVYTSLDEGEYITASVTYTDNTGEHVTSLSTVQEDMTNETLRNLDVYTVTAINADNNYSRTKFIIKTPGTYEITVNKYNADGEIIGTNTIYKSLAYSEEYDTTIESSDEDLSAKIETLAKAGNGTNISDLADPHEITDTFVTTVYRTTDPRIVFAIIAMILFLLDICVRKFKFLWPHEIIRKYKKG